MKSKTTATILAFFLGGMGIHKFYLNQNGLGVIYLVFFWTFIPSILALIDFIFLVSMSEQTFDAKYNQGYASTMDNRAVYINNYHAGSQSAMDAGQSLRDEVNNFSHILTNNRERSTIEKDPLYKDPFEADGDNKYANYDFDGAIYDYLRSLKVRAQNPEVHFKLACLYSILEESENVYHHLGKAVEQGYFKMSLINEHKHLEYIRNHKDFATFVKNGFKIKNEVKLELNDRLELSDTIISQIERLAKMRDQGVINDEEFQLQKSRILNH